MSRCVTLATSDNPAVVRWVGYRMLGGFRFQTSLTGNRAGGHSHIKRHRFDPCIGGLAISPTSADLQMQSQFGPRPLIGALESDP